MILKTVKIVFSSLIIIGLVWCLILYVTAEKAPIHPFFSLKKMDVIAHRGGSALMPENTLEAQIASNDLGVDILEMDLRMTRDRQLILLHDQTLDRTTNCSGPVSEINWADLKQCRVDLPGQPGATLPSVPRLEDVFKQFPHKRMIIEIKGQQPEIVSSLCRLIMLYGKESQVLVASFRQNVIDDFRNSCAAVATAASFKEGFTFFLLSKINLATLVSPKYHALAMPDRLPSEKHWWIPNSEIITTGLIKDAHAKNLAFQVWTVNNTSRMQHLIKIGVDGIMSDHPDRLLRMR